MSTEQEFEVLETMMFERPPEWGRRIIRKAEGEIMLQTTDDKGQTWQDATIPEAKLIASAVTRTASTGNKYAGLLVVPRSEAMTRAVSASEKELNPTITEVIDSGQLLTKTVTASDNGNEVETITFLGTYAASGLTSGQVWQDSNNFLRIVP